MSEGATADGDATPEERYRALVDAPPSAKLVYKVLERESPLSRREISERSVLPVRTTNHALDHLREGDVVRRERDLSDARRRVYALRPVSPPDD